MDLLRNRGRGRVAAVWGHATRSEWEYDFGVFLPSVVLESTSVGDGIELRVQAGQDEALHQALREALGRHPPGPTTF